MPTALATLLWLVVAAALESGGDAASRHGLVQGPRAWVAAGALALVAYGLVVNVNRAIDFGALMGMYIVVFFVVSQAIAALLGERPAAMTLVGGAFIVAGGVIVHLGASGR